MAENTMNRPRLAGVASMRYKLRHMALRIVMKYFPQLMRWGNTLLVSRKRRMHWNARHIGGSAVKKPKRREWLELQKSGFCHALAYRQKKSSVFFGGRVRTTAGICREDGRGDLRKWRMSESSTCLRERSRGTRQGIAQRARGATANRSQEGRLAKRGRRPYVGVKKP